MRGRLVILGMMGQTPFAGIAWQVLHYLEGFRRLGYDIYYVEDTGAWPYDPAQDTITNDCRYTVDYIARVMAWFDLSDRWAYRASAQGGRLFGLSESRLARLFESADALVNLSGATTLREEYLRVPIRIYLETDPVVPEIEVAQGYRPTIDLLSVHTHHFTYGENIGSPGCPVPVGPFDYYPTRQPIALDWWPWDVAAPVDDRAPFTTVGNWRQRGRDIQWNGETYFWSKHVEFLKFMDLPSRTDQALELALACDDAEVPRLLRTHGWRVRDAVDISRDIRRYREYILGSRGEFTVAKDQNIRLRSGWFSDRSACYLAAGKPVVTQDTGFGEILPIGRGLFAFRTVDEIVAALEAVAADYTRHCRASREIATEYFAAEKVLANLVARADLQARPV